MWYWSTTRSLDEDVKNLRGVYNTPVSYLEDEKKPEEEFIILRSHIGKMRRNPHRVGNL
jgi:hypothetical protein